MNTLDPLTKEDIAYMGITEEDVRSMHEQYYLSNKVGRINQGYESNQ